MLKDGREEGSLIFKELNINLPIYWRLKYGELQEAKSWLVYASFSENWDIPEDVGLLIRRVLRDNALANPILSMKFLTNTGIKLCCVINDILDMGEDGYIVIGSPDLGSTKLL
jgi:hypothetical protein